ncbi:hypothetical protein N0V90_009927 [Kalmusia sp. IMI 367209]|nr:hypothetical protein N0V90_009927 [Kalmusia sp. IMI 367209]
MATRRKPIDDDDVSEHLPKRRCLSSHVVKTQQLQNIANATARPLHIFETGGSVEAHEMYQRILGKDRVLTTLFEERTQNSKKKHSYAIQDFNSDYHEYLDLANNAQSFDRHCQVYLNASWPKDSDALDNTIHPIFESSKWDQSVPVALDFYNAIRPALRLASHLLTARELSDWWVHVHYATGTTNNKQAKKEVLVSTAGEIDPDVGYDAAQAALRELAESTRWYIRPLCPADAVTDRNLWDALKQMYEGSKAPKEPTLEEVIFVSSVAADAVAPVLGIASEYVYRVLSEHGSSKRSVGRDMRTQFRLAISLVHEVSHAFFMWKERDAGFTPFVKSVTQKRGRGKQTFEVAYEPYVYATDPVPEVGLSWEHSVFGAFVSPDVRPLNDVGPLMLRPWEFAYSHLRVGALVPMANVQEWFLESTWANLDTKNPSKRLPNVYKCGESLSFIAERFGAYPRMRAFHVLYIDGRLVEQFDTAKEGTGAVDVATKKQTGSKATTGTKTKTELEEVDAPRGDESLRMWFARLTEKEIHFARFTGKQPVAKWAKARGKYKDDCYDGCGPKWKGQSVL